MIIVEGPDGAGKTTLCERLCSDFDLAMGERGTKNRDLIYSTTRNDTWGAVRAELDCKMPPLVWDRLGPFSDPIYSRYSIPSRACAFAVSEIAFFKQFIRQFQIPVIMCLPKKHVVVENVLGDGHQMEGVEEHIDKIYDEYTNLSRYHYMPFVKYDYTRPLTYNDVTQRIQAFMGFRKERERLA